MHCATIKQLDIHCPTLEQSDIHCPNFGQLEIDCPTIRQLDIHYLKKLLLFVHFTTLVWLGKNSLISGQLYVQRQTIKEFETHCSSVRHLDKTVPKNILIVF